MLEVDEDVDVDERWEPIVVVGALRRVVRLDVRDELAAPLRLPARELLVRRVVRGERRVEDRVELGQTLLPVARVLLVLDHLRRARAHLERARSDGMGVLVGDRILDLRPDVFRHDRRLRGDVVEVRHRGRLEPEDDLVALFGDALQDRPVCIQVEGGIRLEQLVREDHVVGAERLAVRPLHARADRERQRLVSVAPLVARREPVRGRTALEAVHEHQLFVHGPEREGVDVPVERTESARPCRSLLVRDRHGGGTGRAARGLPSRGAEAGPNSRADDDERREHQHSPHDRLLPGRLRRPRARSLLLLCTFIHLPPVRFVPSERRARAVDVLSHSDLPRARRGRAAQRRRSAAIPST